MKEPQYQVNQNDISTILAWVKNEDLAIPEIQRPFVWSKSKVRNLMDSLYRGYPVGYLIAWRNPDITMKDGTVSHGRRILIDGQQRVTALRAAILGHDVVNGDYRKEKIHIAFNPVLEQFEVLNPAIEDPAWLDDIGQIIQETGIIRVIKKYLNDNPSADEEKVETSVESLRNILNRSLGYIELGSDLDIETVNEIFERVNSAGVQLSQADFAMSKIAAHGKFGSMLRRFIDYFCHLAVAPEFYDNLKKADSEFANSKYMKSIEWLRNENDDLYDPGYSDLIRVAFTSEFDRGKMGDLVSLLSGRNFETKKFEGDIQEETFERLEQSVLRCTNKNKFKKFVMIIRSAGFTISKMIQSKNALNFAYILFIKLYESGSYDPATIEKLVRRWFVMSMLTGRYSGSPESAFEADIKKAAEFEKHLEYVEATELSDAFWNVALVKELEKSNMNNAFLSVFFASQIIGKDKGFLSRDITIDNIVMGMGDVHHIFPKNYLKKNRMARREYNQIANLVYTQTEINMGIRDRPPSEYFSDIFRQCDGGDAKYGGITDMDALRRNLEQNCIPAGIENMTVADYPGFLDERRRLMADKIKNYYVSL